MIAGQIVCDQSRATGGRGWAGCRVYRVIYSGYLECAGPQQADAVMVNCRHTSYQISIERETQPTS